LEDGLQASVDKAVKAAEAKHASADEIAEVKANAERLAKKRFDTYMKEVEDSIAVLRTKEGFDYTLEYGAVKPRLDRLVKDMSKFYERELADNVTRAAESLAAVEGLKAEARAELEPTIRAIGDKAAKDAAARGAGESEVA